MATEHQAPIAFGAAQAYLQSIEPLYHELEQKVHARTVGSDEPMTANPGQVAPVVSGIAFAIELFLKVLQIQDLGNASRGHDLGALWMPLSAATKSSVEARYAKSLAAWLDRHGLPFIFINATGAPIPIFDGSPSATCADALARLGKSFELWRYMYELVKTRGSLYFNFAEAFGAVDALRSEILEFQGNAVVNVSVNTTGSGP